jgi:glycosyltransferase involved in cell wall biosynthesis
MPLVWDKLPNVKVQIIGSVDKEINTISNKNIEFLGFVENVEPYFLNSKLMVAPLRYGAGVKGKVGQAFEYYLPVVTTSIGAEGMFLENDINAIIVDNATDFANKIIEVYNQSEIWEKLSKNSELSLYPFSKEKLEKTITQF